MLGLIAALLCVSPHAAVNKTDSGKQTPVKSGKGKTRKATTRNRKTEDASHWQKKQPFAALSNDKKSQTPVKQSSRNAKKNFADYRFVNNLPETGKTREDSRSVKLASSVFKQSAVRICFEKPVGFHDGYKGIRNR